MALTDNQLRSLTVQQMAATSAAEFAASLPAFSDANRPAATSVPAGYQIWNTDDGFPNFSNGTQWVDAAGNVT